MSPVHLTGQTNMNIQYGNATSLDRPRTLAPWLWSAVSLALIGVIAYFARMGAVSPRVADPDANGIPRPVEFLFGWSDAVWLQIHEWGTVLGMIWLFLGCLRVWRRQPGHPYVLMAIASTAIVW